MSKRSAAGFAIVLLVLSSIPAGAEGTDLVAEGRRLANSLCAKCHLNEGQGEKQGPMGVPSFRAVANRPTQTFEDVVRWLSSVPPMMPDHKLTISEIDALAAFIMSLRNRN